MVSGIKRIVIVCALFMALGGLVKAQTAPTWSADVASIVYNKCSNCHHAGAIGPFPLMSYQDAFVQAAAIEGSVYDNRMPPWPPDANYRRYAHERLLTTDEKSKILTWIDNGAPEGNPNTAPAPPVYTDAWAIPNPSLTVKMPDYFSEAVSEDMYKCFAIPSNVLQDRYIKSIEVIPGNRSVVHHVLIFQDDSGDCLALDAADPNPGYTNYGGAGSNNASLVIGWVPGAEPYSLPNGFGIKLKANSALVLQIHYPAGTVGQLDSTRVNIEFTTNNNVREVTVAPVLNNNSMQNGPLAIPANQVKTFVQEVTVPAKATVFSVAPHMHLIGRSTKIYAIPPVGDTIPIINIPDWKFGWQGSYQFQYAQTVQQGTILRSEVVYDNTVNNPYNPSSPPQLVTNGEGTADEMILTYFAYTGYQPGDENILMDSTLLTSVPQPLVQDLGIMLYPNPAQDELYLSLPNNTTEPFTLRLFTTAGQLVLTQQITQSGQLSIATLPKGLYIAEIANKTGRQVNKLVKY
ncbi:MAG: T9SS type A sorting domain-containing protein [Sphingobacteriales bacterium JAD_PAG50586_3]|nr:MAG: T9SS type A sorting domain-containing protein [Sphingobacteriales bacterium JAD_PAG50586_3]